MNGTSGFDDFRKQSQHCATKRELPNYSTRSDDPEALALGSCHLAWQIPNLEPEKNLHQLNHARKAM
jgi:hypothetical protein